MFSLRLWKSLSLVMFHVTHTSWVFLSILCRRFIVFWILFYSLLLNFITGAWPEIPCSIVLHFVGMTFIAVQLTGCCMMPDLGEISEHITKIFFIYSNHWDVFFGEVVPLFCFSVLRKSCGVNLFLLSSYFTDIGLLHWYFLKSLLPCM